MLGSHLASHLPPLQIALIVALVHHLLPPSLLSFIRFLFIPMKRSAEVRQCSSSEAFVVRLGGVFELHHTLLKPLLDDGSP